MITSMTSSPPQSPSSPNQGTLDQWREVHTKLTIALAITQDAIDAEKCKRKFLLEHILHNLTPDGQLTRDSKWSKSTSSSSKSKSVTTKSSRPSSSTSSTKAKSSFKVNNKAANKDKGKEKGVGSTVSSSAKKKKRKSSAADIFEGTGVDNVADEKPKKKVMRKTVVNKSGYGVGVGGIGQVEKGGIDRSKNGPPAVPIKHRINTTSKVTQQQTQEPLSTNDAIQTDTMMSSMSTTHMNTFLQETIVQQESYQDLPLSFASIQEPPSKNNIVLQSSFGSVMPSTSTTAPNSLQEMESTTSAFGGESLFHQMMQQHGMDDDEDSF